jgi:hypothetical protein
MWPVIATSTNPNSGTVMLEIIDGIASCRICLFTKVMKEEG